MRAVCISLCQVEHLPWSCNRNNALHLAHAKGSTLLTRARGGKESNYALVSHASSYIFSCKKSTSLLPRGLSPPSIKWKQFTTLVPNKNAVLWYLQEKTLFCLLPMALELFALFNLSLQSPWHKQSIKSRWVGPAPLLFTSLVLYPFTKLSSSLYRIGTNAYILIVPMRPMTLK